MKNALSLILITVVVIIFTTEESTAVGLGCVTNRCWWHQFEGGPCRTSTTGNVGRTQLQRTYKCILGKQRHFCCDPDCGYKSCGSTCASLGLNGNWENVMPPKHCVIPGPPEISAVQHFCCGI